MATEIKTLLSSSYLYNFSFLYNTTSGNDAIRKISHFLPDAVITDFMLSDLNGLDLANKIEDLKLCPCIILANQEQSDFIDELKTEDTTTVFCITKPINRQVLIHTTELAIRFQHKIHDIEQKIVSLQQEIEERKNVERAKGILMKKFNITEDKAYNNIRRKAMDTGKTINEISKTIIKMFEKFKEEE
jgi:response regulator NasT